MNRSATLKARARFCSPSGWSRRRPQGWMMVPISLMNWGASPGGLVDTGGAGCHDVLNTAARPRHAMGAGRDPLLLCAAGQEWRAKLRAERGAFPHRRGKYSERRVAAASRVARTVCRHPPRRRLCSTVRRTEGVARLGHLDDAETGEIVPRACVAVLGAARRNTDPVQPVRADVERPPDLAFRQRQRWHAHLLGRRARTPTITLASPGSSIREATCFAP